VYGGNHGQEESVLWQMRKNELRSLGSCTKLQGSFSSSSESNKRPNSMSRNLINSIVTSMQIGLLLKKSANFQE
jgi:hypothetical protein